MTATKFPRWQIRRLDGELVMGEYAWMDADDGPLPNWDVVGGVDDLDAYEAIRVDVVDRLTHPQRTLNALAASLADGIVGRVYDVARDADIAAIDQGDLVDALECRYYLAACGTCGVWSDVDDFADGRCDGGCE